MKQAEKKFYLWLVSFYYRSALVMLVTQLLLVAFYFIAIQTGVVDPYDYIRQGMPFTGFLQLIVLFTTWAAIPLLFLSKTYDVSHSRTIRRGLVMQLLVYILPVFIY